MSDHEHAFAELMQSLLAQTPDRPNNPPDAPNIEASHDDVLFQPILRKSVKVPASEDRASVTAATNPAVSAFDAAVARFRQQRGA